MATKSLLGRGFKANAEKLAKEYREKLNIHPCAPMSAFQLAKHLSVPCYKATDILTESSHIITLSGSNGSDCEWSALTMDTQLGNRIVIYNPFHSEVRQQSDLMHELAHIICDHQHPEVIHDEPIPLGMRNFDQKQEEEANCLGSTLLLAKPGLLWANKRNMNYEEIGTHFSASVDMVKYRMNMTGIARMMKRKF